MRAKLISGELRKFELKDMSDYLGMKGSTPKRAKKRRKEREEVADADSACPMQIPRKKKKPRKPIRDEDFQDKKSEKDLIALLDVNTTDYLWCYEVCKGYAYFQSKFVNLQTEVSVPLYKKFKEAKAYFECQKCATHSTELAKG